MILLMYLKINLYLFLEIILQCQLQYFVDFEWRWFIESITLSTQIVLAHWSTETFMDEYAFFTRFYVYTYIHRYVNISPAYPYLLIPSSLWGFTFKRLYQLTSKYILTYYIQHKYICMLRVYLIILSNPSLLCMSSFREGKNFFRWWFISPPFFRLDKSYSIASSLTQKILLENYWIFEG